MHAFMQFHTISPNFTQFGPFQPFLGELQHVGYQKGRTQAEKFIGGAFTQVHLHVHTISGKFHAI